MKNTHSLLHPEHFKLIGNRSYWGPLNFSEKTLAIANFVKQHDGLVVVLSDDSQQANQIEENLRFFLAQTSSEETNNAPLETEILQFPEWETLPYDRFSPHQDIISARLKTLFRLPSITQGVLIVPTANFMQKVVPFNYIQQYAFILQKGDTLNLEAFTKRLESGSYQRVGQVYEHGEFAIRGAIIDLFPMGSEQPFRIDLFDDEVESIRMFDADTQRSTGEINKIELLPAKEYNFTQAGIDQFKQAYKAYFKESLYGAQLYKEVAEGQNIGGLEYYLPLFHSKLATLFDYLPQEAIFFEPGDIHHALENTRHDYYERYEIAQHNPDFPLLKPNELLIEVDQFLGFLKPFHRISLQDKTNKNTTGQFNTKVLPDLTVNAKSEYPLAKLNAFLDRHKHKVIYSAETTGRRETLLNLLGQHQHRPQNVSSWTEALQSEHPYCIVVGPLEHSIYSADICVISETQIFGPTVVQKRRRKRKHNDFDSAVSNLVELQIGSPIVHIDHGVGRYLGLETLHIQGDAKEFLMIEYAGQAKLYVPVASLHLISRYSGATPETAPLHKLGSDKWDKAKRKAAEKVRDVAAELLDVYAQRAARSGYAFQTPEQAYQRFAASFPFEETPDQEQAIEAVLADMQNQLPMDRLICGDVGFGKTEVAMRAAFMAAYDGKQVAMLVPTTLLAHQHLESFRSRFSEWPVRIEVLSRFETAKAQKQVLADLKDGKVDIIIGTHKLIQKNVAYQHLGLMIIDEEHRFGVRQKEQLKKMRAEVDVLTMTATPIPRTLNMAMNDLRDLSIIATAPAKRLAVQTFVQEWNDDTVREASLREIRRGGQVYLLFNQVSRIEHMVDHLSALIPEAKVTFAHGQMHERELEAVMEDFYHRRYNILVCTTIIETGIDIPTANTILIHRADKFGLAQLHQLRGRVGRSHHKAYAYMFTGDKASITTDAQKRLTAIAKHDTLGAGFMLASHDLEIRGAGELLGDGQSGQIQEIGFTLYSELLERAVNALKSGHQPELQTTLQTGIEVDLHTPSLIPEDYLPDVHTRLVFYKRIASAKTNDDLRELEVEMIDRFGLLPTAVKHLFAVTRVKLIAEPVGVVKIDATETFLRFKFNANPNIEPAKLIGLIQSQPKQYQLKGQTELSFFDKMPDIEQRVTAVNVVIKSIQKT